MTEELNKKVNFWAAALTIIQIIGALLFFIFQNVTTHPGIVGSFKYIEPAGINYNISSRPVYQMHRDYTSDTEQLANLNQFLASKIPINFIEYNNYEKREYMLDVDKIKCKKIEDSLRMLSSLLYKNTGENTATQYYGGNEIRISLTNEGDKTVKNIKIDFFSSYTSLERANLFQIGSLLLWRVDTLFYADGSEQNIISELAPHKTKFISVWINNMINNSKVVIVPDYISILHDEGIDKIYSVKGINCSNSIDNYLTNLIISNRLIQILLYILVPLGLIYLYFYIFPVLRSAVNRGRKLIFFSKHKQTHNFPQKPNI